MNFFDWVKKSNEGLKQVEKRLYHDQSEVLEIYQRNHALEREIEERTQELEQANKTILTLEHVWDMMNSSRPLTSVLETIVESLQGEFGYLYSCILQKQTDVNGDFLVFKTFNDSEMLNKINKFFIPNLFETRLNYVKNGIIDSAIQQGSVSYYNNGKISEILKEIFPDLNTIPITEFQNSSGARAIILLPLKSMNAFCGCLCVFTPRNEPTDSELAFLTLFAHQIELAITIANLFETVKKQAVTDPLTELFNRRFYEDAINREASRSLRLNQPFSLVSMDLDDLKYINDTYGHSAGDKSIETISKIIAENARSVDIASRVGGEEFAIILPGVDTKGALIMAERLRSSIENTPVEGVGKITTSIGVATFIEQTIDIDELVEIADRAMYNAKRNGKNQVVLAQIEAETPWQDIATDALIEILQKHKIPFDNKMAKNLIARLEEKSSKKYGSSSKELLYGVMDIIAETYTQNRIKGASKEKVNLAQLIAKKFDMSRSEIDKLKIAMLLYDIGKSLIPKDLMRKKGPLSQEEYEKIARHPILAAQQILKPISTISDIVPIIEQHHENWDGTGYPNRLSGEDIPLPSQIILIVDAFYAMLSDRPYRNALTPKEAAAEIEKDAGKKYGDELVKEFLSVLYENNLF